MWLFVCAIGIWPAAYYRCGNCGLGSESRGDTTKQPQPARSSWLLQVQGQTAPRQTECLVVGVDVSWSIEDSNAFRWLKLGPRAAIASLVVATRCQGPTQASDYFERSARSWVGATISSNTSCQSCSFFKSTSDKALMESWRGDIWFSDVSASGDVATPRFAKGSCCCTANRSSRSRLSINASQASRTVARASSAARFPDTTEPGLFFDAAFGVLASPF